MRSHSAGPLARSRGGGQVSRVFEQVIFILSYIYRQRTQALDELYSIVTGAIEESGADARLLFPHPGWT
ncbi:MAG: hypothetical protein DRK00_05860 [Thermoprotei archaeon]|nr:MAG: hypothetical protein DRK00_05860 [Thermoprotei archaeon]